MPPLRVVPALRTLPVLLLFPGGPLAAQALPFDEAWRWTRFTTSTGLPSDDVRAVVEDELGPWALTRDGFAWYDGFWWNRVERSGGARGVSAVEPIPGGGLLVVVDDRLYLGDRDGFRPRPVILGRDTLPVTDAVPVGADRALVVSVDELLAVSLSGPDQAAIRTPPAPMRSVAPLAALHRTRSGAVWLTTLSRLWRSTDGGETWAPFPLPGTLPSTLADVAENDAGGVLAVDRPLERRGVWAWRAGEQPRGQGEGGSGGVTAVEVLEGGAPVVAFAGAEMRLLADGEWQPVGAPLVPGQPVADVTVRPGGDLWVASDEGLLLHRGSSRRWESWRYPFPDLRNRVHDILVLPEGSVWVASADGVEVRDPEGHVRRYREAAGVSFRNVTGLARGPEGAIWVVSGGGFPGAVRYLDGRWERVGLEGGGRAENFHRVRRAPDGTLWFLGLRIQEPDQVPEGPGIFAATGGALRRLALSDSLPSGRVYDVSFDGETLWVATLEGLSRRTGDGRWRHWDTTNGLRVARVWAVVGDGRGGAWFADQSSGLGRVDADGVVRYRTRSDGLADDEVWGLLRDGDGLWIATAGGISYFDGEKFNTLRAVHGLPHLRVWPLARSGDRLFMGTLGAGVAVLDLAELPRPPEVRVADAEVGSDETRVRWMVAAEWGAMDAPDVRTRWRLDGGAWSAWSDDREVELEGLSSGVHRVEVQAAGLLGRGSSVEASAPFRIEPPIWRRPVFLGPLAVLLAVLASVIAVGTVKQRQYRRSLEESRERYRRFFQDDLTGDCLLDSDGRITDCNPAFARIFGFGDPGEAVGLSAWEFVPDRRAGLAVLAALRNTGRVSSHEIELEARDGRRVYVVTNLVAEFDGEGAIRQVRGYVFDDTERKELLERVVETRKTEAVGRLAGGVAHEFNNLLTAVSGNASLLLDHPGLDESTRRDLGKILEASKKGAELTDQLLAFGRRGVMRQSLLDVGEEVERLEPLLRGLCEPEHDLTVDRGPGPSWVRADPDHLQQVVVHLVLNARDALGQRGRVGLSTRALEVADAGAAEGDLTPGPWVVLEVADDGGGMSEEEQQRMFEPFHAIRADRTGPGSLGLAMVYGLVRQNGGTIAVDSEVGDGTRVRVFLPAVERPEPTGRSDGPGSDGSPRSG